MESWRAGDLETWSPRFKVLLLIYRIHLRIFRIHLLSFRSHLLRSRIHLLKLPEDAVQANSSIRSFLPEVSNPGSSTKLFGVLRWSHLIFWFFMFWIPNFWISRSPDFQNLARARLGPGQAGLEPSGPKNLDFLL